MTRNFKNHTDEELIHIFLETRNTEIIGEWYLRYSPLVLGLMLKYTRNSQDASDLMMDIFEKIPEWIKKHSIQNFKAWLYVTSKNHVLMYLRKKQSQLRKISEIRETQDNIMESSGDDHLITMEIMDQELHKRMDQLKSEQRKCLELFYFQNKSYKEIESITGWSYNEIKSHIQNGKRNLKNLLSQNHE